MQKGLARSDTFLRLHLRVERTSHYGVPSASNGVGCYEKPQKNYIHGDGSGWLLSRKGIARLLSIIIILNISFHHFVKPSSESAGSTYKGRKSGQAFIVALGDIDNRLAGSRALRVLLRLGRNGFGGDTGRMAESPPGSRQSAGLVPTSRPWSRGKHDYDGSFGY